MDGLAGVGVSHSVLPLCTAFLVLPLLPPFACCILGPYTIAMASVFMKWRNPEAALPWSGLDVSNRKFVMDSLKEWCWDLWSPRYLNELPLEIFEKGLEPRLWNSVRQLSAGDFFPMVALMISPKLLFSTSKNSASRGVSRPTHSNPPSKERCPAPSPSQPSLLPLHRPRCLPQQVLALADWDKYCLKEWGSQALAETDVDAIKDLNEGVANVPCAAHRSAVRSCIPAAGVPCSQTAALPSGLLDCPGPQPCDPKDLEINATFVDLKVWCACLRPPPLSGPLPHRGPLPAPPLPASHGFGDTNMKQPHSAICGV